MSENLKKKVLIIQHKNDIDKNKLFKLYTGHEPTQEDIDTCYKIAFCGIIDLNNTDPKNYHEAEQVWHLFNSEDRPNGKTHRSMSIGDVVKIDNTQYLCMSIGFKETSFNLNNLLKIQPLDYK